MEIRGFTVQQSGINEWVELCNDSSTKFNSVTPPINNHPSGIAEPSQSDQRITTRLQEALDLVGVRVIDHMVVGDKEVISFAERGLL